MARAAPPRGGRRGMSPLVRMTSRWLLPVFVGFTGFPGYFGEFLGFLSAGRFAGSEIPKYLAAGIWMMLDTTGNVFQDFMASSPLTSWIPVRNINGKAYAIPIVTAGLSTALGAIIEGRPDAARIKQAVVAGLNGWSPGTGFRSVAVTTGEETSEAIMLAAELQLEFWLSLSDADRILAMRPYLDFWRPYAEGVKGAIRHLLAWFFSGPADGEAPPAYTTIIITTTTTTTPTPAAPGGSTTMTTPAAPAPAPAAAPAAPTTTTASTTVASGTEPFLIWLTSMHRNPATTASVADLWAKVEDLAHEDAANTSHPDKRLLPRLRDPALVTKGVTVAVMTTIFTAYSSRPWTPATPDPDTNQPASELMHYAKVAVAELGGTGKKQAESLLAKIIVPGTGGKSIANIVDADLAKLSAAAAAQRADLHRIESVQRAIAAQQTALPGVAYFQSLPEWQLGLLGVFVALLLVALIAVVVINA